MAARYYPEIDIDLLRLELTAWQLLVVMGSLKREETVLVHNVGGGVGFAAAPRIGDFKAGQFALDLNYGLHLRLPIDSFVIAGPGARNGIDRCFAADGKRYDEVIRLVRQYQDECSLAALFLLSPRKYLLISQNQFCTLNDYPETQFYFTSFWAFRGNPNPLPERLCSRYFLLSFTRFHPIHKDLEKSFVFRRSGWKRWDTN